MLAVYLCGWMIITFLNNRKKRHLIEKLEKRNFGSTEIADLLYGLDIGKIDKNMLLIIEKLVFGDMTDQDLPYIARFLRTETDRNAVFLALTDKYPVIVKASKLSKLNHPKLRQIFSPLLAEKSFWNKFSNQFGKITFIVISAGLCLILIFAYPHHERIGIEGIGELLSDKTNTKPSDNKDRFDQAIRDAFEINPQDFAAIYAAFDGDKAESHVVKQQINEIKIEFAALHKKYFIGKEPDKSRIIRLLRLGPKKARQQYRKTMESVMSETLSRCGFARNEVPMAELVKIWYDSGKSLKTILPKLIRHIPKFEKEGNGTITSYNPYVGVNIEKGYVRFNTNRSDEDTDRINDALRRLRNGKIPRDHEMPYSRNQEITQPSFVLIEDKDGKMIDFVINPKGHVATGDLGKRDKLAIFVIETKDFGTVPCLIKLADTYGGIAYSENDSEEKKQSKMKRSKKLSNSFDIAYVVLSLEKILRYTNITDMKDLIPLLDTPYIYLLLGNNQLDGKGIVDNMGFGKHVRYYLGPRDKKK